MKIVYRTEIIARLLERIGRKNLNETRLLRSGVKRFVLLNYILYGIYAYVPLQRILYISSLILQGNVCQSKRYAEKHPAFTAKYPAKHY